MFLLACRGSYQNKLIFSPLPLIYYSVIHMRDIKKIARLAWHNIQNSGKLLL